MNVRSQGLAPMLASLPVLTVFTVFSGIALLCFSCAATSVSTFATPEEATAAIVTAAEAGDKAEAVRIFDSFARSSVQRDRVYATLFDAASERYESGRSSEAARILDFVTAKYPNAIAAREALVYALFLERADGGAATASSMKEMRSAISAVRSATPNPSPWIDLAETQVAIDEGDLSAARVVFAEFLGDWDGTPDSIVLYVEDIDRYLQSH